MNEAFRSFVAVLLLANAVGDQAQAADAGSRRLAIAEAMTNMMDAMGLFGQSSDSSLSGSNRGWSEPWNSFSPGTWGSSGMPGWGPSGWRGAMPQQMMRWWQPPQAYGPRSGSRALALEGSWISNTGERLLLSRDRFRLQSGPSRIAEGLVEMSGNRLALHLPKYNATWVYEYALHEGRLALKDSRGRLYLYRRAGPGG
jgi:hypothetical protein